MKNKEKDNYELGQRIKAIRESRNLTQKQLAEILNVSQTAVALWENGQRGISFDIIDSLCEELDASIFYLLWGIGDPSEIVKSTEKILQERVNQCVANGEGYINEQGNYVKYIRESLNTKSTPSDQLNTEKAIIPTKPTSVQHKILDEVLDSVMDGTFTGETYLLASYNCLNEAGKKEAIKRIEELTEIKKYTE